MRDLSRTLVVAASLLGVVIVAGCRAELGECDPVAARYPIYYADNGLPAYPGQALVILNCGRAHFCHASGAVGEARWGAPVGLELDLGVVDLEAPDVEVERARLRHARRVAFGMRHEILGATDGHTMPPDPPAVNDMLADPLRYRAYIGTPDEREMPSIESPEGREILRNWLACGAQVVEATSGESSGIGDIVPAVALCPDGQADCGTGCADVTSDAANCGGCGVVCGGAQSCVAGRCACATGLEACGASCVDLETDGGNCGACGFSCDAAAPFCAAGSCIASCPPDMTCGTSCVDTSTSTANCGVCENVCPVGALCIAGRCACDAGLSACAGACVDTSADAANCGGCGVGCAADEACVLGACVCADGLADCGGTCVDLSTDAANCGSCGNVCPGSESCGSGACVSCGATVSFATQIQPIFSRSCAIAGCHTGSTMPAAGLRLDSAAASYASLVNRSSGAAACGGRVLVRPGDVAGSYLVNKLTDVDICAGSPMPKRGVSLSASELDLIRAWICEGAPP